MPPITLSEAVSKTPPKILWYGAPGSWKTTTSLTWGSITEVIDLDKKLLSALKLKDKFTEERMKVDVTPCIDVNPLAPSAFQKFKDRMYMISDECSRGVFKKKILVIDSLTSAGEHSMRMVLRNNNKLSAGTAGKNLPSVTQAEWGLAINELDNMLTVAKSLPLCVIILCHELTEELDGVVKKKIWALGSKLPDKLPVGFDEIWYSKMAGAGSDLHAVIQTKPTNIIACTRGGLEDGWDTRKGLQDALTQIGYVP